MANKRADQEGLKQIIKPYSVTTMTLPSINVQKKKDRERATDIQLQ